MSMCKCVFYSILFFFKIQNKQKKCDKKKHTKSTNNITLIKLKLCYNEIVLNSWRLDCDVYRVPIPGNVIQTDRVGRQHKHRQETLVFIHKSSTPSQLFGSVTWPLLSPVGTGLGQKRARLDSDCFSCCCFPKVRPTEAESPTGESYYQSFLGSEMTLRFLLSEKINRVKHQCCHSNTFICQHCIPECRGYTASDSGDTPDV